MVFTPGYISINVHNKRALLGKYSTVEAPVKKCHPLRMFLNVNNFVNLNKSEKKQRFSINTIK